MVFCLLIYCPFLIIACVTDNYENYNRATGCLFKKNIFSLSPFSQTHSSHKYCKFPAQAQTNDKYFRDTTAAGIL